MTPDAAPHAPVIGITAHRERVRWGPWNRNSDVLASPYADMITDGGAIPLVIPARMADPGAVLERLDGLILSGGPDVDPRRYGRARGFKTQSPHPDRDQTELALLSAAADAGKPVLGDCRGAQLLNVWRGGALEQHIYDTAGRLDHGDDGQFAQRWIQVSDGSWLRTAVGDSTVGACHHHQAVGVLGRGVIPVAWAEDRVVEAIELDDVPNVIGLQWHPEESGDSRIFAAFIATVRAARDQLRAVR